MTALDQRLAATEARLVYCEEHIATVRQLVEQDFQLVLPPYDPPPIEPPAD